MPNLQQKPTGDSMILRRLRESADLSREDAAAMLGITENILTNMETGRTKVSAEVMKTAKEKFAVIVPQPFNLSGGLPLVGPLPVPSESLHGSTDLIRCPVFLVGNNRFAVPVGHGLSIELKGAIRPNRDILVIQRSSSPRPGRIGIYIDSESQAYLALMSDEIEDIPVGYAVAIMRDAQEDRGTIIWDEGGIAPS